MDKPQFRSENRQRWPGSNNPRDNNSTSNPRENNHRSHNPRENNHRNHNPNYRNPNPNPNYRNRNPNPNYHNKSNNNNYNNKNNNNIQNSSNNDINRPDIKEALVDYIYKNVNLSRYKYTLLKVENDLKLLNSNERTYYVSPNYNGVNSMLVFIKMRGMFCSFIVDRRTLSYNRNQLDLNKVKLIQVSVRLDESVYNGTIIDGVLLYNTYSTSTSGNGPPNRQYNNNNSKTFVINDVYKLSGKDLTDDKINHKMMNITAYLNSCYVEDKNLNSVTLVVNSIYHLKDIKALVHNFILKSKYKSSIKGLAFYSDISETKLVYLYSNCSVSSNSKDESYDKSPVIIRDSNIKIPDKAVTAVFRISSTDTVDVYNLSLYSEVIKDGNKFGKYKKYCRAYIPTSQCSYFCKDLLTVADKDSTLVECQWIPDKSKWIPIKAADKDRKLSDSLTDVTDMIS